MQPTTDGLARSTLLRSVAAALGLSLAACGGAGSEQAGTGGRGSANDGGIAADAGLKAGASVEECRTPAGMRLCGTSVTCYEHGPDCECIGDAPGSDVRMSNAAAGYCGGLASEIAGGRHCGYCLDGDVCVRGFGIAGSMCVAEDLARVAWLNGLGHMFTYADGSPYNGVPIPSSEVCPPPDGDLELCGGECGGCSKPGFYCTGRSPIHPLGVCTSGSELLCTNRPDSKLLSINDANSGVTAARVCVRDCERLAATVPGGAACIDPQ